MSSPGKYRARTFCIDREAKGYLFVAEGKSYIVLDDCKLMGVGLCGDVCITDFVEVRPESVEQYTGLKDKNGVEIYEDDVSQTIIPEGIRLSKFVYFYDEALARFRKKRSDGEIYDCDAISEKGKVIIGDIHTTPELLEGSHE